MQNIIKIDPKIKIKNCEDFINEPIVIRIKNIEEEEVGNIANSISKAHETGQSIIPIVIDSYGGDVYAALSIMQEIKNSELPVATIIEGKAMSAGALLFTCGSEGHRYMSENATLMIHDVHSDGEWGKVMEQIANTGESKRLNNLIYNEMAKNCGHKKDYFSNMIHEMGHTDWYVNTKDAIKHNIANHIRVPKLITKITVDINLI